MRSQRAGDERQPARADQRGPAVATGGFISFAAPHAATKLYPAAVLTSPAVNLGYDAWSGSLDRDG